MEDFIRFAISEGFSSYGISSAIFYSMDDGVGPDG